MVGCSPGKREDTDGPSKYDGLLAYADVYRCHAWGKWLHSVAEIEDKDTQRWLPRMLRRRLFSELSGEEYGQLAYHVEDSLVPFYQRFYREACLDRWEFAQFAHYSPACEGKLTISYFQL